MDDLTSLFNPFILKIILITSIISIDCLIWGQFMISRPVVTGFIIGYYFNQPIIGITVGMWIEFVLVKFLPIGVSIPPDIHFFVSLNTIVLFLQKDVNLQTAGVLFLLSYPFSVLAKRIDIEIKKRNNFLNQIVEKFINNKKFYFLNLLFSGFIIFSILKCFILLLVSIISVNVILKFLPTNIFVNLPIFITILCFIFLIEHFRINFIKNR